MTRQPSPIRVLESFREPKATTNPYIVMLHRALTATPGLKVEAFSWRRALLGRVDVYHVHWPEVRLEGRTWWARWARAALMAAFLLKCRICRTAVVRTRHNVARPTGISRLTDALLAWHERQTAHTIVLNDTWSPAEAHVTVIPHGHYRDWYAPYPAERPETGRMAYFGLIRQYKGVPALVRAFRSLEGDYRLHVAGKPSRQELSEEIREAAGDDPRITLDLRFLPDADLVKAVTRGQVVVLPYSEMHNSGGVLAALSLDRPVLVPQTEVNDALANEVGHAWVMQYGGALRDEDLRDAVRSASRIPPSSRPDLSRRDWDTCGRLHAQAFYAAVDSLR